MSERKESIETSDGPMNLFVVTPEKPLASQAGIIVLQEAFGVNNHVKNLCRRFAQEGYFAVAPDLFHRSGADLDLDYKDFSQVKPLLGSLTNVQLSDDMKQTFEYLKNQKEVNPKNIFSTGYCMGGFVSILGATQLALAGAISYYGGGMVNKREGIGFSPIIQDFGKIKCPTLFLYGGEDQSIPAADREAVDQKLTEVKNDHVMTVFSNAGHAFFCEDRPAYNADASAIAWPQTLTWLKEHSK